MSQLDLPSPSVLVFGEVLFDCFPDGSRVLGGAPFNVAWNLQGLGARPVLVSRVGRDEPGQVIRSAMQEWGMDTRGLETDPEHGTGMVEIQLDDGEATFDILAERAYDFIEAEDAGLADLPIDMVVHGTVALRGSRSRASLGRLLRTIEAPVFYDVNLRAPWWDHATVEEYLSRANAVKLNESELVTLTPGAQRLEDRVDAVLGLGPSTICLTRGEKGAIVFSKEGRRAEVEPATSASVVDTVGAGDAFASVFILGSILGWDAGTIVRRAQDFAQAVVGIRGATVTDESFYREFREAWSGA